MINNQWEMSGKWVKNRPLSANPDIRKSRNVNFEIYEVSRIDFRLEEMNEFAALLFNDRELYSVQFNGDDALDGFEEFICREIERRPLSLQRIQSFLNSNQAAKMDIIRDFMVEWLQDDNAANLVQNEDPKKIIQRFISMIGLNRIN